MAHSVKVGLGLYYIQKLLGDDYSHAIALAKEADRRGLDQVSLADHLAISAQGVGRYPDRYPMPADDPWVEPVSVLSAIAAVTERIRLSCLMIAPLRPALLLAKQLATLDVISHGRLDLGVGVGWQEEEYAACGQSFEHRFSYFDEQIAACRALWQDAPACFKGRHIQFEDLYCLPSPLQTSGIPVWMGFSPTERSFERIAKLGDGWIPASMDPSVIAAGVAGLHDAFVRHGRNPKTLEVRAPLAPIARADGSIDLDASFDAVSTYVAAGVTLIEIAPFFFCRHADEIPHLLDRMVALKK
jgi:probable F420-dependent oxidoreductase